MKMKRTILASCAAFVLFPSTAMAADHEVRPNVSTPAADLRADLDYLLSEHFVLAVETMQKTYDEAPDAEAVEEALLQNSMDMVTALEPIYGEEGAEQFGEIFVGHNDYTDAVVEAEKAGDEAARSDAEEEIEAFVVEFAAFLDTATEGNLPQEAAEEAIRAHEMDVLSTFDNYADENYEAAYTAYRDGFDRMYDISEVLSGAIVSQMPETFDHTAVDTPAAELRSTWNQLASEHFALATLGMQKGLNQADDYDFAAWAENQNSQDFQAAIASIYGEEAGSRFLTLWEPDHINAQGDLVAAAIEDDMEKRETALNHIDMFTEEFGAFLEAATDENLSAEAAQETLTVHEEQILRTFDKRVEGNYTEASDSFREGYQFMFGVGEALSGAITKQMPEQFAAEEMPEEMPATGLGGTSSRSIGLWALTTALFAAAGAFLYGRKKYENEA
ncbi:copper amine oxidase [Alkalicoccus halolimnae]|uniref:Copper amine oxidase n=1 Tax=Alkalicoccus halolimnae TaxID=1667239 RepID=A0A5C7FFJ9_9BACI|nr:copper amine oxidase [Alkalicoccus halolimnae]TXF84690.1 copper amine oxidase [Alkalicoccus halolimnae]